MLSYCVRQDYETNTVIQFIEQKLIDIHNCEWTLNTIATANFILWQYSTVDHYSTL